MMTHDEIIAVVQAHKEGKTIQYKGGLTVSWTDRQSFRQGFNFHEYDYRVRPEPKVLYVNEYAGVFAGHASRDAALSAVGGGAIRKAVKYVEVLEG